MSESPEVGVQACNIIAHQEYSPKTLFNDIAVIRLSTPLNWSSEIQPICLPTEPVKGDETTTVIGWGTTEDTGDPNTLREVTLPIISWSEYTQWISPGVLQDKALCAGYEEGLRDSSQGDSGGPLFRVVDGFYQLVGVVSWGYGCADPQSPGVYADVYKFSDWIKETAGDPVY